MTKSLGSLKHKGEAWLYRKGFKKPKIPAGTQLYDNVLSDGLWKKAKDGLEEADSLMTTSEQAAKETLRIVRSKLRATKTDLNKAFEEAIAGIKATSREDRQLQIAQIKHRYDILNNKHKDLQSRFDILPAP